MDGWIDEHAPELVKLVQDMIRCNTVSVDLAPGSSHRQNQESELQALMAERLLSLGAEVDQWEPDPREFSGHPMMPPWHHWAGRPLTVGTFRGTGGGRSLVINGHIDVVSEGDRERWSGDPFGAEIRGERIYGRGAVDMKGGLGAALFGVAAVREAGMALAGDVIFEVVTDEETCAMGTVAAIARGYRGDAGLVPEPTGLGLWIATRGVLHGRLSIPGRAAHAEVTQPPWREGGGVNAIERSIPLLMALEHLNASWRQRASKRHPLLGIPRVQPTVISGGSFVANIPDQVDVSVNATYVPADCDANGFGSHPRREIVDAIGAASLVDDWLREHPPSWTWMTDYPPSQMASDEPIIATAVAAARALGLEPVVGGIDSSYDGALLTRFAGTPSPAFGPGDTRRAHAIDEWIGLDELLMGAKAYARVVAAWCGVTA